jgi:hypothetical protein
LKNLIPSNIVCVGESQAQLTEGQTCYQLLISKLGAIYENLNVNENKII